jgi:hypothetical protein
MNMGEIIIRYTKLNIPVLPELLSIKNNNAMARVIYINVFKPVIQTSTIKNNNINAYRFGTAAMNLHLAAISADVAPGRHAALLLD